MDQVFTGYLTKIEEALHSALPEKTNQKWQKESFLSVNKCVTDEHLSNLIKPCRGLMDLGGKRWRPLLLVLCAQLARESGKKQALSEEETFSITPLVEFVHTASLIHDDIEDSADTRRGKPAAHITYGIDAAINAASWLYFEAAACIENLNAAPETKYSLLRLYTTQLRRLHLGQAMDIYWHNIPELIPAPEEYTQMVHCKTGTLASLAVQAGILSGGGTLEEAEKAGLIAENLGEGFQILDDVQNLTTGNPGKKRGDDIVEGKKSLPVLIHIKNNPNDARRIARCFEKANEEGIGSPAVEDCIEILESKDSIKKAREKGISCITENIKALTNLYGTQETSKAADLINRLFTGMIPEAK